MVTAALLLQIAVAPPLDSARLYLSRGDTARAVTVLLPMAAVRDSVTSDHLAALFLLQWIGRGGPERRAQAAWRAAGSVVEGVRRHGPAADVLVAAVALDEGEADRLVTDAAAGRWEDWIAAVRDRAAGDDPLLAGGAAWLLVQRGIWAVRHALDAAPSADNFPAGCGRRPDDPLRGTAEPEWACLLREAPPPEARAAARVSQAEGGRLLPALRADLGAARRAPWPFSELAVRIRVALEALLQDSAALDAVADDTAGLDARAAHEIRVVAFEMSGRRHAAAREMEADTGFGRLDHLRHALPPSGLAADVFWQAAWPLYLEPYNARLVAHRARVLLADLVRRAGPADQLGFFGRAGGADLLVRLGVPAGQIRVRTMRVFYVPAGFHETLVRTGDPSQVPSLDLALAGRDDGSFVSTESGFQALDYDRLVPLEHQVFQYVRSSGRVVAFHGLRPGTLPCTQSAARVRLFLLDHRLKVYHATDQAPDGDQHRFSFRQEMSDGEHGYSLEYLDRSCRVAARARYVLTVGGPGRDGISDLALADSISLTAPRRLDGEPAMAGRAGVRIPAGDPIHLYWEMYGMDDRPDRRLRVTLEVVNGARRPVPVSALSGLDAVGEPGARLEYETAVPGGRGPLGLGLSVRLTGDPTGVHVARLVVVDQATGREYRAERPFYIAPRG